ncbi:hypothetical protein FQA39_LY13015 [Lamprigera yunnana]|nr:hypothetical protein FQA39_LY13015 [Lamprigera yunnana]
MNEDFEKVNQNEHQPKPNFEFNTDFTIAFDKEKDIKNEDAKTSPPNMYNQASLVKELKNLGIGRPSTYTPIITKLKEREYTVYKNLSYICPPALGGREYLAMATIIPSDRTNGNALTSSLLSLNHCPTHSNPVIFVPNPNNTANTSAAIKIYAVLHCPTIMIPNARNPHPPVSPRKIPLAGPPTTYIAPANPAIDAETAIAMYLYLITLIPAAATAFGFSPAAA